MRRDSPRSPLLTFAAYSEAVGTAGVLATPSFGADLGIAWLLPRGRVELAGLWLPGTEIKGPATGAGSSGGSFALIGGTLSGCWSPLEGRALQVGPCVGVEGAAIFARANGSAPTSSSATSSPWVAGTAGGFFVWRAARYLRARVSLDLVVPFVRNEFAVREGSSASFLDVHTPSPVGARAGIGVETTFP